MAVKEKTKEKKTSIPAPWYTKSGIQPFQRYFSEQFETKSGAPWYTKKGMNELLWEDGERPKPEYGAAPIFTKQGWNNFTGKSFEEPKPREPPKAPLFTKTGWAEMKKKYGTEVEWNGPVDFMGLGTKIQWNSISKGPIYTKTFWNDIQFEMTTPTKTIKEKVINEEGEEVEIEKTIIDISHMTKVPWFLWFTKEGMEEIFQGSVQKEYFMKSIHDENGAPIWTRSAMNKGKVPLRTNDGDVLWIDRPEN